MKFLSMLFQAFGLQDFGVHATPDVIYVALSTHLAPLREVLIPCKTTGLGTPTQLLLC